MRQLNVCTNAACAAGTLKAAQEYHREGVAHLAQREVQSAVAKFEHALELGWDPLDGVAERWTAWMLLGEFERAWQETDRIESTRRRGLPVHGQLVWDGSDFTDRVVLLRIEHGIGDAIQFVRYVPLLRRRCSRLIVRARPILRPLLEMLNAIDEVISDGQPTPQFDVQMESMELPYVFRTTLDSIPSDVPYIPIHRSSGCSPGGPALKVGLAWASGPWNPLRSIHLTELAPLSGIPNVQYHSLQWGPEWIQAAGTTHGLAINHASAPLSEDLIDTREAILQCDLMITVDTMVAHLAGALAKPVWVLLSFDSDWRWMLERPDSPWYPSMKLFRQRARGDWSIPVHDVARELRQLVGFMTSR